MVESTLEELMLKKETFNPDDGITIKGYACYPSESSFFLTDAKPGEEYNYLIDCQLSDTSTSELKNQILTYSKLYHDTCAKNMISPVEIHGSSYRPKNNGTNRLFPQLQKISKLKILE